MSLKKQYYSFLQLFQFKLHLRKPTQARLAEQFLMPIDDSHLAADSQIFTPWI